MPTMKKVFKSRIQSCRFLFKDGHEAAFVGGKFFTNVSGEIEELVTEIERGHPHIWIDASESEIDTDNLDPFAEIKRTAIADYLAAQEAAFQPSNDRGSSESQKLVPASSASVAKASAGSTSGAPATK